MNLIGIDIGTTSVCGVSLDANSGKVLKSFTKTSNAFITSSFDWEKIQSVDKILENALDILENLVNEDTVAIGVTGQMHGIVYTDENGNAVSPLYTWQDQRGNLPYLDTTYAKFLNSSSGFGGVTNFYNKINGIVPKNAISYCTICDYLVMKLCNLKTPIIHQTNYASLGKGAEDCNAKIVDDYCIAGHFKGIPVSVAIGDNQASVFSTLVSENDLLINVGTGSQISVIVDTPINSEDFETRPYFDGKYLLVGAALCGGRAYSILKTFFSKIMDGATDEEIYSRMAKMAEGEELSLKVDCRFEGTRKDRSIKGSITGITESNFTPAQLTLGFLDGIITELYDIYQKMNCKKTGIVGSGNGIRKNALLIKQAEKTFNAKMQIPMHNEEACYGCALFAGISSGIFNSSKDAHKLIKYM